MPASIPIRHGGTFASRDTILARATFSRSTIPPRASRPIRCSVFLPGSIPMVTTAVANNLQQSWRFDWEPPKAVLRDVRTIDWILGWLRSSAQADPVAGRPVLGFGYRLGSLPHPDQRS